MSGEINNRTYRKKVLKELIRKLHEGKTVEEVQEEFAEVFQGVSAGEISEAEQALIEEGMPVEEIQKLCDVHAAVFKGSIEEIHRPVPESEAAGHPLQILKEENRALEDLINGRIRPQAAAFFQNADPLKQKELEQDFKLLSQLNLHYLKKENLLFPYLEKYGITAPPKVMWGVDDEIRGLLKEALKGLSMPLEKLKPLKEKVEVVLEKITEMIFKEDNILFPMLLETLALEEWHHIREEFQELGFCLITDVPDWKPVGTKKTTMTQPAKLQEEGHIVLPTGVLKLHELITLLDTLPIDITFVDATDTVKYFSQGAERVFPRTKAIIGRKVINCHPPASMHIVEAILDDFKSGKKDHEDFWIKMADKYIYIRYFAMRNEAGEYLGTLEVTQNIQSIQALTGEKRLVAPDA